MQLPLELTLEQQANLKNYEFQVRDLTAEQAQGFLLEVMRQMMVKDNVIRCLMKSSL